MQSALGLYIYKSTTYIIILQNTTLQDILSAWRHIMQQATIRNRLRYLRDSRGVSQESLSEVLGFNDRQTLSDIELGNRNVRPEELVRAAQFFNVTADYFTDPFELAGEARFSWRKTNNNTDEVDVFEERAGRWIAAFRHLNRLRGNSVNSRMTRIGITEKSSFEDAAEEGDAVSRALELGDVPASTLTTILEDKLDTLVLFVDTVPGVSGAACQLGPLNIIIINRGESKGRRSFDVGHELFHLITWSEMAPPHIENSNQISPSEKRIEKLADNFASGLLMPRHVVLKLIDRCPIPPDEANFVPWIKGLALELHVSGQALKWCLAYHGIISGAAARRIDDSDLRIESSEPPPARFSRNFVDTLGWGIEEGHLSARKAANVVGTTVDDLADLFVEHGLKTPFDL